MWPESDLWASIVTGIIVGILFILWTSVANAADCVVYNVDSERGESLFVSAAADGAVLDPAPENMIPRSAEGKPYPGTFKAVCRDVPEYIAGEPMHCINYNRDEGVETLCQWQVWGGQAGYWTEHGDWVDYTDPCASYNEALKKGEKVPNEPTCTGIDDGRPMPFIPQDGSEISA
jgi:hypothetical protein